MMKRKTWRTMNKFANDEPLTAAEWEALSHLTLIDRSHLEFGPGNVRWAKTEEERASNLAFYKSLGSKVH
jgi:hypothetical protein